jgi:hypothetical protein
MFGVPATGSGYYATLDWLTGTVRVGDNWLASTGGEIGE